MSLYAKLKAWIDDPSSPNDGSKEVAESYLRELEDSGEFEAMLNNKSFKHVLENLRAEMRERFNELVEEDPVLKAQARLLVQTVGRSVARKEIEKTIAEFLGEEEDDA